MQAIKMPSIGQFRNAVHAVKSTAEFHNKPAPTITMTGLVKVHGTNASVVFRPDGSQTAQSKTKVLDTHNDNAGFCNWTLTQVPQLASLFDALVADGCVTVDQITCIYGEWAGKGVQSGVGVSNVDKFFYIFGICTIDEDVVDEEGTPIKNWLANYPSMTVGEDIIDAREVWKREITIDFGNPAAAQNELVGITNAIEADCPVARAFGAEGIGEGVVWSYIDDKGVQHCFKVKGEKHSVSKVKTLAEVDPVKVASIASFVDYAVTDNRLQQGLEEACAGVADRKSMGLFMKWIAFDLLKEESDVLDKNELTMKDVAAQVKAKARAWFFEKENLEN